MLTTAVFNRWGLTAITAVSSRPNLQVNHSIFSLSISVTEFVMSWTFMIRVSRFSVLRCLFWSMTHYSASCLLGINSVFRKLFFQMHIAFVYLHFSQVLFSDNEFMVWGIKTNIAIDFITYFWLFEVMSAKVKPRRYSRHRCSRWQW